MVLLRFLFCSNNDAMKPHGAEVKGFRKERLSTTCYVVKVKNFKQEHAIN